MDNSKFIRVVADHIESGQLFRAGILNNDEIATKVRAAATELDSLRARDEKSNQRDYRTVSYLVSTLANICSASPNQTIDLLTGYLWDEAEAVKIKTANQSMSNG